MAREPATNDCKPQGTHKTLGLISRIDELNSMEEDPLKEIIKASLITQNEVQSMSFMIWRNSDEEHVHERMTLCVFHMH